MAKKHKFLPLTLLLLTVLSVPKLWQLVKARILTWWTPTGTYYESKTLATSRSNRLDGSLRLDYRSSRKTYYLV